MKINCLFLTVLFVLLVGCKQNSTNIEEYNFSELGLEKIECGNISISLGSNGLPDSNTANYDRVGVWNEISFRRYDLIIKTAIVDEKAIVVKSKYNDISVEISKKDGADYFVEVTRKGRPEKIIYTLSFRNIPKP